VEFIRNGIVMEVIGKEGLPFLPFLTSIFVFVWVNNLYGIIPGIQFPTTARMAIRAPRHPRVVRLQHRRHRQAGWVALPEEHAVPAGRPHPDLPLYSPIEFFSVFVIRPLTLSVRLAANMIAGHLILTIFFVGTCTCSGSLRHDPARRCRSPLGRSSPRSRCWSATCRPTSSRS
jgi:F-type H+-transporting ATPase subunit a